MSELSSMNLELTLLVLTVLDLAECSLWVFAIACLEIYLVLESPLTTMYHDISNGMSECPLRLRLTQAMARLIMAMTMYKASTFWLHSYKAYICIISIPILGEK